MSSMEKQKVGQKKKGGILQSLFNGMASKHS